MTLLSHYTDRAGLEGIAETGCLWATNFLSVNDTSEGVYALRQLVEAAFELVLERVPDEHKIAGYDIRSASEAAINQLKEFLRSTDGYGHLYVTSFARGTSEDHDIRGIRTLWDLYNGHRGYCLQFDETDVRRLLELDSWKSSYESVGMSKVHYGVDPEEHDFRELRFQLSQKYLLQILRTRSDIPVEPEWNKMWAESHLSRKVMEYSASHKDPCFEDEREVRIFAFPAASAEARVFTGIAGRKTIRTTPHGKQYVVLGEHWRPGIMPQRIIIGTKADRGIDSILAHFHPKPVVTFANMPIA